MSNFYHCKTESRGEQAMAFWQLHTGELLQYNDAFAALLEKSQAQLQVCDWFCRRDYIPVH